MEFEWTPRRGALRRLAPVPRKPSDRARRTTVFSAHPQRLCGSAVKPLSPKPPRSTGRFVTAERRSEIEVHADVDLPHSAHRRRPAEERRDHRAAVALVVGPVRQILGLNEELEAVTRGALIERAHLR